MLYRTPDGGQSDLPPEYHEFLSGLDYSNIEPQEDQESDNMLALPAGELTESTVSGIDRLQCPIHAKKTRRRMQDKLAFPDGSPEKTRAIRFFAKCSHCREAYRLISEAYQSEVVDNNQPDNGAES